MSEKNDQNPDLEKLPREEGEPGLKESAGEFPGESTSLISSQGQEEEERTDTPPTNKFGQPTQFRHNKISGIPKSSPELIEEGAGGEQRAGGEKSDAEEMFVILPEDGADTSQLPVVETVVVEDQGLGEMAPQITQIQEEIPPELNTDLPTEQPSIPLEQVGLKRTNPLMGEDVEEDSQHTEIQGLSDSQLATSMVDPSDFDLEMQSGGEDIGVMDEIADFTADLDGEGDMGMGMGMGMGDEDSMGSLDDSMEDSFERSSSGSRTLRLLITTVAVATFALLGLFFYGKFTGGGDDGVATATANAGTGGELEASRQALRQKIFLAVEVGLRAEAQRE